MKINPININNVSRPSFAGKQTIACIVQDGDHITLNGAGNVIIEKPKMLEYLKELAGRLENQLIEAGIITPKPITENVAEVVGDVVESGAGAAVKNDVENVVDEIGEVVEDVIDEPKGIKNFIDKIPFKGKLAIGAGALLAIIGGGMAIKNKKKNANNTPDPAAYKPAQPAQVNVAPVATPVQATANATPVVTSTPVAPVAAPVQNTQPNMINNFVQQTK
ncbi:MAG: hypothetical protein E7Z91_04285 [Cyanobacteria bacterium SIG30]|nr:hypothetical protein [Cyanobacteria bacterium SIG30]